MNIRIQAAGADGELIAVPAIHYRMAFAYQVRKIIWDDESRPKAVAVELGPQATAIIASWLREIGPKKELPCMLGLLRKNRLIHKDHRNDCLALQERYRVPLHQVPLGELLRSCNFSPTSLICLSAVDSIIEAIRSAVEYELPIYGIDLEESAAGKRKKVLLEDPSLIESDFKSYVRRSAMHCADSRDSYIDHRRERHMASQLRCLLSRHERVLFTGGLAHWLELQQMLMSPDPPAMPDLPLTSFKDDRYIKVIVDPNLAICQMDSMPNFTSKYEDVRKTPAATIEYPNPMKFLESTYEKVVTEFGEEMVGPESNLTRYFAYLENLLLLRQRYRVDFATALEAAAIIMSPLMACRWQKKILYNSGIEWLRSDSDMKLPYLQALSIEQDEHIVVGQSSKVRLIQHEIREGEPFLVDGVSDEDISSVRRALCLSAGPHGESIWGKSDKQKNKDGKGKTGTKNDRENRNQTAGSAWIWPPCEALYFGTAYRLTREYSSLTEGYNSEPFNGSLHAGIDVKASLRSFARGKNEVYVRFRQQQSEPGYNELQQPFVYLLQSPKSVRPQVRLDWKLLGALSGFPTDLFVGDSNIRFQQVSNRFGEQFISSVIYRENRGKTSEARDCPNVIDMDIIWGSVSYGNPVLNAKQGARWLTETDFKCCPVLRINEMEFLIEYFEKEFGISLNPDDWPDTLIRLAIPFAKKSVLIVAPERNVISHQAQIEARERGIHLDFVPISYLSATLVREIQTQWSVRASDANGTEWPDDVIRFLGRPDANFDLLPPAIRNQALPND